MVGFCADFTRYVWGLRYVLVRKRQNRVTILYTTKAVLAHTLLKKDLTLTTRLRWKNINSRNPPNTQGRILQFRNIPQLLYHRPLSMNSLVAIPRSPATRTDAILRNSNHLAPLDKRRNVKKRIMRPTILTGNCRRMLVNHTLKSSRRHSYYDLYAIVWVLLSEAGRQFNFIA